MAEGQDTKSDVRTSFGFWPEADDVTRRITVRSRRQGGREGTLRAAQVARMLPHRPHARSVGPLPTALPCPTPQERIHRLLGIPEKFGEGLYGEQGWSTWRAGLAA